MLLVITNAEDATADYLCGRLADSGFDFARFNTDCDYREVAVDFSRSSPRLYICGNWLRADRVSHIWFRRPKPLKPSVAADNAEVNHVAAEWSEAIEGFLAHVPHEKWMNHPAFNAMASHKMEQLTRAKQFGLNVPSTIVTQDKVELRQFWEANNSDIIVKPLASGYIERDDPTEDTLIFTNRVSRSDVDDLRALQNCPTLFQERICKTLDVRITIVDNDIHPVGIRSSTYHERQKDDIRRNNMSGVSYCGVELPAETKQSLQDLVKSYGLRFAAIDMAIDTRGRWVFFEINSNGQWAWLDLLHECDIASSFIKSFDDNVAKEGKC